MSEREPVYRTGNNNLDSIDDFKGLPCTFNWTDEEFAPPTPDEIGALQKIMKLNTNQLGVLVGATYSAKGCASVRRWKLPVAHHEKRFITYSTWRLMLVAAGVVNQKELLKEIKQGFPKEAYVRQVFGEKYQS